VPTVGCLGVFLGLSRSDLEPVAGVDEVGAVSAASYFLAVTTVTCDALDVISFTMLPIHVLFTLSYRAFGLAGKLILDSFAEATSGGRHVGDS